MKQRILFLGCGAATRTHSRILAARRDVALYYASRDGAKAIAYCREFGGVAAFDSYEQAMARNVDTVVVATPPATHIELTLDALRARKNVIVEKPAFMQAADCDIVAAAAEAACRRVLVAENYPYKPIVGIIRGAVQRGELGDIRFVSINATKLQRATGWRANEAVGGNPLLEGGIHWLSFLASLGLDIENVQGHAIGGAGSTLVVVRYAGGASGTLAFSWELPAPLGGLRLSKIQGTKGAITFESNGFFLVQTGARRRVSTPALIDPTGARAMWKDFLTALETNTESRYSLAMARRDLSHVEAATLPVTDDTHMRWGDSAYCGGGSL